MHETAKKLKRRGFLLLEGVLLLAVLSALSVGTTAIFSGQFNTMNAGKQASQAQQYASVEGTYVRVKGYPNVDDLTHDWKDMSDLVGTEDGANWESKVEVARTAKTDDGNEMKVVKLSVRKKGDIVSRFSEEIPLVSGMEVYTKDEIDTMFDTVDSEINNLNSDLDAFKNQTAANFTDIINNINTINGNLDTLRQMIEAEKATREAAINAEHNAWMAALQNEQAARTARDAELTSQLSSLQDSLSKLQSALNTEISQRKAEDSKLKAADNNLQQQINKEVADRKSAITTLQNDVNSKYEELKNLYNNLKGRLDGSEFVKSKDSLNNIALKYEQKDGESTKSLHGYVDGVEVPLASQDIVLVPDYSSPTIVMHFHSIDYTYPQQYASFVGGACNITNYSHYWLRKYQYNDSGIVTNNHYPDYNNETPHWVVPKSGYIVANYSFGAHYNVTRWTGFPLHNGEVMSFDSYIVRGHSVVDVLNGETKTSSADGGKGTPPIPVRKGDVIYFGTRYEGDEFPTWGSVIFYPALRSLLANEQ